MRRPLLLLILLLSIVLFFVLNLLLGTVRIPMIEVCRILLGG